MLLKDGFGERGPNNRFIRKNSRFRFAPMGATAPIPPMTPANAA